MSPARAQGKGCAASLGKITWRKRETIVCSVHVPQEESGVGSEVWRPGVCGEQLAPPKAASRLRPRLALRDDGGDRPILASLHTPPPILQGSLQERREAVLSAGDRARGASGSLDSRGRSRGDAPRPAGGPGLGGTAAPVSRAGARSSSPGFSPRRAVPDAREPPAPCRADCAGAVTGPACAPSAAASRARGLPGPLRVPRPPHPPSSRAVFITVINTERRVGCVPGFAFLKKGRWISVSLLERA